MKRLILLCLLLAGCAQRMELQTEPIALLYSAEEASKTDALSEGDEVSVYVSVDGTQNYFLEDSRWTVGSDGKALVPPQPLFYPDPKQAVSFYAYFGSQHVPADQSTAAALKQADLCWASASSTPSNTPVPLTFNHIFARLVVTCSAPTSKITTVNVFSGGTLDIRSGAFANSTKSDVSTTGNELIVPAQTLNRLVVTSNGIDYVFDGSIALESGKTTTANLTLHTSTQTATLNGSSVSAWAAQTSGGNLSEAVSNVLTLHWPNYVPQGATPDKVAFTINGSDYTVPSGISYANQTFTVPFASSALRYPYTISKITFYNGSTQSLPACTQLLGATVYKSAAATLGIKDQAGAIKIGNLWWATGNLVADGPNGCRIGAPTDYGLYFQFGSLIGWSGGSSGDGKGQGTPALSIKSRPAVCINHPGTWISNDGSNTFNNYYFTYNTTPYSTHGTDLKTYSGFVEGSLASKGIGDPCTYYLGSVWRLPTPSELTSLTGATGETGWGSGVTGIKATLNGVSGFYFGPGLLNNSGIPDSQKHCFFSRTGARTPSNGSFYYESSHSFSTTSFVDDNINGMSMWISSLACHTSNYDRRSYGMPARCVNAN